MVKISCKLILIKLFLQQGDNVVVQTIQETERSRAKTAIKTYSIPIKRSGSDATADSNLTAIKISNVRMMEVGNLNHSQPVFQTVSAVFAIG